MMARSRSVLVLLVTALSVKGRQEADNRQPKVIGQLSTLVVGADHFEPLTATPATRSIRLTVATAPPRITTSRQVGSSSTRFATKTIYGFLDFITTVGSTVMVFTPDSKTQDPKRKSTPPSRTTTTTSIHRLAPSAVSSALRVQLTSVEPPLIEAAGHLSPSTSRSAIVGALFSTATALSLESSFDSVPPPNSLWSRLRHRRPTSTPTLTLTPTPTPTPVVAPSRRHPTLVPILVEGTGTPSVRVPPETKVTLSHNVGYRVRQPPATHLTSSTSAAFPIGFLSRRPASIVSRPSAGPPRGRLVLSTVNVRPTGLVTIFGGTDVTDGRTTVHTTSVIGTYIGGRYAQILQSSSTIFSWRSRPTATARGGASALPRRPTPVREPEVLPLERLFSSLDSGQEPAPVESRPSRDVITQPRPARFTLSHHRGTATALSSSRRTTTWSSNRRTTTRAGTRRTTARPATRRNSTSRLKTITLPPRRSYSGGRKTSHRPSSEGNSQLLHKKRREKGLEENTDTESHRPSRRSGSKTAALTQRQRQQRRPESLSQYQERRAPYQEPRPQHQDAWPQYQQPTHAPFVITRPHSQNQEHHPHPQSSRLQHQESRPQHQESRPQRQESRPQRQESRPQHQESRPQHQESRPQHQESRPQQQAALSQPQQEASPASDYEYYYDDEYYDDTPSVEETVGTTTTPELISYGEVEYVGKRIKRPPNATDYAREVAAVKTERHVTLGRYTTSQWVTQTTRTVAVKPPTVAPSAATVAPTRTAPPSAVSVTQRRSAVMLPAVQLDPSSPSLPMRTTIETFSTSHLVLRVSVIPLVIGDSTQSLTITQSYHVTRLVTALMTIPLMGVFRRASPPGLLDSNATLVSQASENQVDEQGVPLLRLPPPDKLEHIGSAFDPDMLGKKSQSGMVTLQHQPVPTATTATPALPPLTSPLSQPSTFGGLSQPGGLSQLNGLNQLTGLGQLAQLTPQQLLYMQLLSPYMAALKPQAAAAAAAGPRTVITSSPVLITTTITTTKRLAVQVTFRARPSIAYFTKTSVVSTVLTSYVTSTMTLPASQPFFG